MNLPVLEFEQGKSSYGQSEFSTPYLGVGNLDFKINHKQIIKDYILSKQGSFAYEVERIKMLAGREKENLELHLKDLKTQIEELKKKLNNKLTNRLEELQKTLFYSFKLFYLCFYIVFKIFFASYFIPNFIKVFPLFFSVFCFC